MSLCLTCAHATVIEGSTESERLIVCRMIADSAGGAASIMRFAVRRCSEYSQRDAPQRHDLEDIAWRINLDRRTQQIGFLSPLEWRRRRRLPVDDEES